MNRAVVASAVLSLLLPAGLARAQAVPTGIQEYFIIGHSDQLWRMLDDMNAAGTGDGMNTTTTLTATTDIQTVVYDHWEDGYDPDPFDEGTGKQATTLILGDGNTANGNASDFTADPTDTDDTIDLDEALAWKSREGGTGITDYVPINPRDPGVVRYDAPDRIIVVGGPVNLVHAVDPRNQYFGGAMAVLPKQLIQGNTSYVIPMGEDQYAADSTNFAPFEFVQLMLISYDDNVSVSVDNGTTTASFQLSTGDTWSSLGRINLTTATPITIDAGTTVTADGPVAALVVTSTNDSNFQARFYSQLPEALFTNDYVIPVHGDDPAVRTGDGNFSAPQNVYLYNPDPLNALTIRVYDSLHSGDTMVVQPLELRAYTEWDPLGGAIPTGSTARFVSDRRFWGVAAVGYTGPGYDWGYSLVPTSLLTDFVAMSWAPGNQVDPPSGDAENGSPVWISPLMDDTTIQVDWEPDGTFDNTYTVNTLESLRLLDSSDNDQTGMRIWGSNKFVAAWGQDTDGADHNGDCLDLGYEIMPQDSRFLDTVLSVEATANKYIVPQSGGGIVVVTVYLRTDNTTQPVSNLTASFNLPANWSYVNDSTNVTFPIGSSTANPTQVGNLLSWDWTGQTMTGTEVTTLEFQMTINDGAGTNGRYDFEATAGALYEGRPYNPRDGMTIVKSPFDLTLTASAGTAGPGQSITYTATLTNNDTGTHNGLEVRIPVPFDTAWTNVHGGTYDGGCDCVIHDGINLAAGGSQAVQLTVAISTDAAVGGSISNEARADVGGTYPELISAPSIVDIDAPVLDIHVSGPSVAGLSCPFTYEVTVTNNGNQNATNTAIDLTIPANSSYVSDSMSLEIIDSSTRTLTCNDSGAGSCSETTGPSAVHVLLNSEPLVPGGQLVFTFDVDVTGSAGDTISASASTDAAEIPFTTTSAAFDTLISAAADSDGDGLDNGDCSDPDPCGTDPDSEVCLGTEPYDADTDDDGLSDGEEHNGTGRLASFAPTDPTNHDSDGDGLPDGLEVGVFDGLPDTDVFSPNFGSDTDVGATTTDPNNPDTDGGGIWDGDEDLNSNGVVNGSETDPNVWSDEDGDGDGLTNADEDRNNDGATVSAGEPDWQDADTDDDGILDGAEVNWDSNTDGTGEINALDPDSDDDGIYDGTEVGLFGVSHPDTNDGAGFYVEDADMGVTVTSMVDAETDGDGVDDGAEDLNGNGALDQPTETDPANPDTDGDTYNDNPANDCAPRDPNIYPGAGETPADGTDQDCDGVDTCYADSDLDGFGTSATVDDTNLDCTDGPAGVSAVSTDCDDAVDTTFPGSAPNDNATACMADADGDDWGDSSATGPVAAGTDCDDSVDTTFPGSAPNDNASACMADGDGDDWGDDSPGAGVAAGTDCDDTSGTVYPGAAETPDDTIDQDCSGTDTVTCSVDADGDTFGHPTSTVLAADGDCTDSGESGNNTDCDDGVATTFPGAAPNDNATACMADADGDDWGDQFAGAPVTAGTDCNDAVNTTYPGATESVDDGVDQDCNGFDTITCAADADGDTFGHATNTVLAPDGDCTDAGESVNNTDCDDAVATVYPGASEVPDDNVDQDCNGFDTKSCFADTDQDGYGDAGAPLLSADGVCAIAQFESADNTDCDDDDNASYPGATELCDGNDNVCTGSVDAGEIDDDSDGYVECTGWADIQGDDTLVSGGDDCDDNDAITYPAADEQCDGNDNACVGSIPSDEIDDDTDTYVECSGWSDPQGDNAGIVGGDDCLDANDAVYPTATEVCDGYDTDCSSGGFAPDDTDEQDNDSDHFIECEPFVDNGSGIWGGADCDDADNITNPGVFESCDGNDNNCDGTVPAGEIDTDTDTYVACSPWDDSQGDNPTVVAGGDCDEGDPNVNPGATEIECNSTNDDCDFSTPDDPGSDDDDYDGFTVDCGNDCDDTNYFINTSQTEQCLDGLDNNCDGLTDDEDAVNCPAACTTDLDGDGFLDASCGTPDPDCDDTNPFINPNAAEDCSDGVDNNCNGFDDSGDPQCPGGCDDLDGDGYLDRTCGGSDCDDTDNAINPGIAEICNDGIDNNCDGRVDTDDFQCPDGCDDIDGDGYFDIACGGTDCNDGNAFVHPDRGEACEDGIDNDCDGQVDVADSECPEFCVDADGDSFRDETCNGTDCADDDANVNPGEFERCSNGIDDDCDGDVDGDDLECPAGCDDADADGFIDAGCGGTDCDDANRFINPAATEQCNDGIDNNCDIVVDEDDTLACPVDCTDDADNDGFPSVACGGTDCADTNPTIHPNAAENCGDGIDNDCDGDVDGDDPECLTTCDDVDLDNFRDDACGGTDCDDSRYDINPGSAEICVDSIDNDCDGDADGDDSECPAACDDIDDDGYYDAACGGSDCDDTNPSIHPDAGEACFDGVDNNCDLQMDEGDILCPEGCDDVDGDWYFDAVCGGSDCDDTDPTVHPGVAEDCTDTIDNDCDGRVDEDDPTDCPAGCDDADGDGYYDRACGGSDCNDSEFFVNAGQVEVCNNSIDDDCDGMVDFDDAADCPIACYDADLDGDGHLDAACGGNDCDDTDPNVHPNAAENCADSADNDCDGHVDGDDLADCPAGCDDADTDGFLDVGCGGTDCNDGESTVNPWAMEVDCDGVDNDCNGLTPDLADHDTDGYVAETCTGGTDCDDADPLIYPDAGESCVDTIDNNCDGLTDGDDPYCNPDCIDADGDGYRDATCGGSDCDDLDPNRHPGAGEHCRDGLDNDCDDDVDYADAGDCPAGCLDLDGDGYLAAFCGGSDCNDLRFDVNPGSGEQCADGLDNNCNGLVDLSDAACNEVCSDADIDGYDDALCGGDDCDDSQSNIHPAAGEHCSDGIDNNCDGRLDGDDPFCPTGCDDADGDGYYDVVCGGSDCNDSDSNAFPGAWEICGDGADNNCNGAIDTDDVACPAGCVDADGDGFADAGCGGLDCDDLVVSINPAGTEVYCNGIDEDCQPASFDDPDPADVDGDGYTAGCGNDCDESNPWINEGAAERCDDGVDNNCDGNTDNQDSECPVGCADADGDGYYDVACGGTDCDDQSYLTNPGAGEHCSDEADNNCDGLVDGADAECDPSCADADGDGYTDAACGGGDCDDDNPDVHPGGGEHCTDGLDNNCNGFADGDDVGDCPSMCVDADGDGYTDRECGGSDCDDEMPESYPGAGELCDGADNDCDGTNDESYANLDGDELADCVDPDADGDGWDDDVTLSGGGCYCGGVTGGGWALVGLLLLRRRRRRGSAKEGV